MGIKENHLNGKIISEKLQHVIYLVEIGFLSMQRHFKLIDMQRFHLKYWYDEDRKQMYAPDVLLELYAYDSHALCLYQLIFDQNGKDFHEFFYQIRTKKSKMYEYFAHEFPIDYARFKRMRVPEKNIKHARSKRTKDDKRLLELTSQNMKAFYDCLDQPTQRLVNKVRKFPVFRDKPEQYMIES